MRFTEQAELYPNACICGHGRGPFIDLQIDKPVLGHLYLCVELCVDQATREAGGGTAEDMAQAEALLSDAAERETELKSAQQEDRRVFLSELLNLAHESGLLERGAEVSAASEPEPAVALAAIPDPED